MLDEVSNVISRFHLPRQQEYILSLKYRLLWHQGDFSQGLDWASSDYVLPNGTELIFAMDFPGFTKIRIILSNGSIDQIEAAFHYLEEIESILDAVKNSYHSVEILVFRAMYLYRKGQLEEAKIKLNEAVVLGSRQGVLRPLIELGQSSKNFRMLLRGLTIPRRLATVLNSFGPDRISVQRLPDEKFGISPREWEVIDLVAQGLRNIDIADQLNISEVTVKSHLNRIFKKIQVKNRIQMIQKLR